MNADLENLENRLVKMKSILNSLEIQADSTMLYCILSDAVFWSDEVPSSKVDWPTEFSHAMRYLFHYRMSKILGRPDLRFSQVYERAQSLFPDWPGFVPERQVANKEFMEFLATRQVWKKTY